MFGFDPKTFSNDELFTKQVDLVQKKVMAARLGRADTINQLDSMIQAIDAERQERLFLERYKAAPASPVVIETDPSLRQSESAVEQVNSPTHSSSGRPVRRTIRSATPVLPTEGE